MASHGMTMYLRTAMGPPQKDWSTMSEDEVLAEHDETKSIA